MDFQTKQQIRGQNKNKLILIKNISDFHRKSDISEKSEYVYVNRGTGWEGSPNAYKKFENLDSDVR